MVDALAIGLALPAGFLVADLISAFAHWFGDTFFDVSTPLIGAIIGPFRLHHDDPDAFRRHGVWHRNRNNVLAALPLVAVAYLLFPKLPPSNRPFWGAAMVITVVVLAGATQIHAWAHDEDAPRLVRWLQRAGILISRERHARHHRGAHDRSYAIVSGWTNPVLDGVRLFRRIETWVGHERSPRRRGSSSS